MHALQHVNRLSLMFLLFTGSARAAEEAAPLRIEDGSQWRFSGSPWSESDGVIKPPDNRNLHSRAFYVRHGFEDLTAEFEFNPNYRELGHGGAGLILRAKDAHHFYAVYFPWGGQALRSKHFWASIVKVDGDGYLRSLKSAWVPGVASEVDRWFKVRVTAKGPNIDVWVDGRRAVSASDATDQRGAVGLMGYGWYFFRNVRITGDSPTELPSWTDKIDLPSHGVALKLGSNKSQSACIAPRGDVLLAAGNKLVRSKDGGRTWGAPETLPDFLGDVGDLGNCMFRAKDGRLLVQIFGQLSPSEGADGARLAVQGGVPPKILMSESVDNGATWKEPVPAKVESPWPERPSILTPCGAMVQTDDGTMVRFVYGSLMKAGEAYKGNVITWGEYARLKAFAIRSTDGGKSWSKPIEIDQPSWPRQPRGSIPGSLDFTEVTGVAIGNSITALVRPVYSPYLWQCSSTDSGVTWDHAVRTTFPGYGGPTLIRLRSGMLVCGHRMPHYSLHLSSDGGLNWDEGTVIDYPAWAMGTLLEVEPNVLLATYWNWTTTEPLLAQRIRVHADRLEPDRLAPLSGSTAHRVDAGANSQSRTRIDKLYFLIHPACWSLGVKNGKLRPLPKGINPEDYLACYQRELLVLERQKKFISAMQPNEALALIPIGQSPQMLDLEDHADRVLGPRCIALRRVSVDPPAEWEKLADPFQEFLDNDQLLGKDKFLEPVPRRIHDELCDEIRTARQSLGGRWNVGLLEMLYFSRLLAMDIQDEIAARGLYFDPQTVQSEAFGEGFEECAMHWKAMVSGYLGMTTPPDNIFDLSVSGLRLLLDADFKERVPLKNDVRLYLWQAKDGRPIGLFARSRCRLSDPRYYVRVPLEKQTLEVWTQVNYGTKVWPAADGPVKRVGDHLVVPILNGIRRDPDDGAFYIVAEGTDFDAFRRHVNGVQITP